MNKVNENNLVNFIMEFEDGGMSNDNVLELFSYLIKTGQAWSLQGSYGRMAKALIENRYIDKNGNIIRGE
jgi:hypothetical protein